MTAITSFVLAGALIVVWFFRMVRHRRAFPILGISVVLLLAVGFSLNHCIQKLRCRNLTSIRLLPGYVLVHRSGDDTYTGSISRPEGLSIKMDIGGMSGWWANPAEPAKHLWVFEQQIGSHKVYVGLRKFGYGDKEKLLCVTYPHGSVNFFAVVQTEQDIAEMLGMVLTYEPLDDPFY